MMNKDEQIIEFQGFGFDSLTSLPLTNKSYTTLTWKSCLKPLLLGIYVGESSEPGLLNGDAISDPQCATKLLA